MFSTLEIVEGVIILILLVVAVTARTKEPAGPPESFVEKEINRMERTLTNRANTWTEKYWIITIQRIYESGRIEYRTEKVRIG